MDLILRINQQTCRKCGTCAATCPRRLIDFQTKEFPRPNTLMEILCTKCGHCVSVCPTCSLTHRDQPLEKCPDIQPGLEITPEQCTHFLRSRRSVRVFKNQPVSRDVITGLIEIARYAPSSHNKQDVEWLVIDNPQELLSIESMGLDWMRWMIANQPKLATAFKMDVMYKQAEIDRNRLLRGGPVLIVAHAGQENPMAGPNCTVALNYLDLAAKSQGLGCCWVGMLVLMSSLGFPQAKKALPVPEGHMIYGCIVVGYPKFKFPRMPFRRPPQVTWR
jgi:nitroreductase/Pyruvate/2-oxoacid:ferredoxin oxidoreductase delta subunit